MRKRQRKKNAKNNLKKGLLTKDFFKLRDKKVGAHFKLEDHQIGRNKQWTT